MSKSDFKEAQEKSIIKRNSILRPDIHKQINELLDQDYRLSPDKIITNVDRINFNKIDKMNPPQYTQHHHYPNQYENSKNNLISLNIKNPRVTKYTDIQIQTDLSFKDIKARGDINPVFSDVEILGFTYMTEQERIDYMKSLMSDDYPIEKFEYDPCCDFASFSRDNDLSRDNSRSRSNSSQRINKNQINETRSIASQTLFTSKSDQNQSTQTIFEYTSPSGSSESSPMHNLVIAKTKTTIKSDPDNNGYNKIKERFSIKNKQENEPFEYNQTSEYKIDNGKSELVKSTLDLSKPKEKIDDKKKLVKSTMEMTSVINNKTTVTGISVKDAPERFTIQIINPNESEYIDKSLIEDSYISSRASSPLTLDKKLTEDLYDPNDFKLKLKPFNLKCDDEKVLKERDNGFNSAPSNNSSIRSRVLDPAPRPILQSTPDLSFKKNITNTPPNPPKKVLSDKNILNHPELNDLYKFSVHQVPKMFRYEAKEFNSQIPQTKNFNLPESLRKKLNQTEMVVVKDGQNKLNVSQKSIIKSRNPSQSSQKQVKIVDFNIEDNEMIDIDFDSYDKPTIKQVVKEIEVPIDENLHVERASFRSNSSSTTSSTRPEIKERKKMPTNNTQALSEVKNFNSNQQQSFESLKQRLLSKNQIDVNDGDVIPKPDILNQNHNISKNEIISNSTSKEKNMNEILPKPKIRVFSQSPTRNSKAKNTELTRSHENLHINSDNEFNSSGIFSPLKYEKKIQKVENFSVNFLPKTKMEKLIEANIEKEYKKALKRTEYRNQRIPEIIKLFNSEKEKNLKSLEEELRLLMRKAKIDEELIRDYESVLELEAPNSYNKNLSLSKNVNKNKFKKDNFKSSNRTLESGYSSCEDSLSDLKKDEYIPNIKPRNENIISMLRKIEMDRQNILKLDSYENYPEKKDLKNANYKTRKVPNSQGSGSGSNRSAVSNQNTLNNSVFSSPPNSTASSMRNPNGNDDSDDDEERRKKKNVLDNRRNVNQKEPSRKSITYVEEEDLENVDLSEYSLEQDSETGEAILVNLKTNESYVVLVKNWRESPNSFYIAEPDINTNDMDVFVDERTNRRFVIDPKTNRRYFLISLDSIKKLGNNLEKIEDSDQVIRMKYDEENEDNQLEFDYVEQSELSNVNLDDFAMYEDENSGEIILTSRKNTKKRWIILPNNWKTENSAYIDEDDINLVEMDVYQDTQTKRKYVIDDKTGQRFYLIPKFRQDIRNFMNLKENEEKSIDKNSPNSSVKPRNLTLKIGGESIENLENEPSNLRLREIETKTPTRVRFDPNLPSTRSLSPKSNDKNSKIIIKQPGKPGHLIRTNSPGNNNQQKPPRKVSEQRLKQEQARKLALAKIKQDASRQAFFQQKLPDVGKLWMHQLLINKTNKEKQIDNMLKAYNSSSNLSDDSDSRDSSLRKPWRSLNHLNDPTVNRDENGQEILDRKRLAEIQIYGYDKFDKSKKKRNIFEEEEKLKKSFNCVPIQNYNNNDSFGGFENYPFIRGVLTEDFVESKEYHPVQMNKHYRALVPHTKLNLRQQFLTSPRYLKPTWDDILKQSKGMQPRFIIINDDELILTKNRECNIYVQYEYPNDAVLGANKAYQLMLPDRGPTNPARPLMISPAKLSKQLEQKQPSKSEYALREAPVYVYHQNGNAFYENLAQYLAGNQPKLSPKTARKILQFSDLKEFEDYLASKLTREEANRLSKLSGEEIISIDGVKEILNTVRDRKATNGEELYYHKNCEYDPLRPFENERFDDETKEYEIGGTKVKSTFIGFDKNGDAKKVKFEDLPKNLANIVSEANSQDSKK
ncbi:unnamed protein product [Brachionus calyciflorus]|uniref:Uncharacterized protein n=1 Tax=Brachionus calyciflorus TaxID=104777 RepID=A0A813MUY4_9BILA|nr:unnamed protein product [Brachionus calyciflorus]